MILGKRSTTVCVTRAVFVAFGVTVSVRVRVKPRTCFVRVGGWDTVGSSATVFEMVAVGNFRSVSVGTGLSDMVVPFALCDRETLLEFVHPLTAFVLLDMVCCDTDTDGDGSWDQLRRLLATRVMLESNEAVPRDTVIEIVGVCVPSGCADPRVFCKELVLVLPSPSPAPLKEVDMVSVSYFDFRTREGDADVEI